MIGNYKVKWKEDVVGSFLGATGTLQFFTASSTPTLLTLGGAYDEIISSPFQNSLTVLGVATSCAQFAYEKYDKSKDRIIYCNVCSMMNPIQNDRCKRCNNLLFK